MTLSVFSLLRSLCGLAANWHKIRFTWQRVNRALDEHTLNAILHECADLASSGDGVALTFLEGDSHHEGCDLPLANVKEVRLAESPAALPTEP